jgi:hypothetical protein
MVAVWLAVSAAGDNRLQLGFGASLSLGFTGSSPILHWRRRW